MPTPTNESEQSALSALPDIPRDEDGPVFKEPWQAQVFSMACLLHEKGHFSWDEWATALGTTLQEMPDDTEYYLCWLKTLEQMTLAKDLVSEDMLSARKDAWDLAARNTPHGEPIELG